jgi:flavocytochrome c
VKVLTYQSGSAVEWLQDQFNLDLSLVSRLGGHSYPRTHRGKERFPGMTITYALMEKLEELALKMPGRVRLIKKAKVTKVIMENGEAVGVEYDDGQVKKEYGVVVISTGGYAADFTDTSLLKKYRPELWDLPTTNGDHSTGDGIKMATAIGGNAVDLDKVQVHPTGLVDPNEPDAKWKFLAAEALRGCGGLLLDADGNRFCDELGHRDYVTGKMWANKGPFRLVLNGAGSREIEWHCKHYVGRGLMKRFNSGAELAKEFGIPVSKLEDTFQKYNKVAKNGGDPFGKKYFHNFPFETKDFFHVAIVTPVLHFTMGGLEIDHDSQVLGKSGPIAGLYAAGECAGGVHGANRLGGSSLLGCVVYGRVAGRSASRYMLSKLSAGGAGATGGNANVRVHIGSDGSVQIDVSKGGASGAAPNTTTAKSEPAGAAVQVAPAPGASTKKREISLAEVAKHNTEKDCWVVVNGEVLDVTKFLPDHPGGKKAILLFAGKDATDEFNMLHKPDVVQKYAADTIIGFVNDKAKSHL